MNKPKDVKAIAAHAREHRNSVPAGTCPVTHPHTHTHTHTHTRARVLHVALVGVKLGDGEQVIATFDFADDDPEKLSFVKGDILQVSAV
jgi:hypothetical protein